MLSRRAWSLAAVLAGVVVLTAAGAPAHAQDRAQELQSLAQRMRRMVALEKEEKYPEAIRECEEAVAESSRLLGSDHEVTTDLRKVLARLRRSQEFETLVQRIQRVEALEKNKKYAEAIRECEVLLAAVVRVLGPEHETTTTLWKEFARLCRDSAYKHHDQVAYTQAEPLYQRSLQIREAKLGKDHPDVAISLNDLATLYSDMGQYDKAAPLLVRSLKIREAKLGKDHIDIAQGLHNLAFLYVHAAEYGKAEPLFQRSLEIYEAQVGKDHPDVATCLNNLAGLYEAQGQYGKAEPLYQRSLQIREAKLGNDHLLVAQSVNNLGALYGEQRQYAKAEPLLLRSLQICEVKAGKDHPDLATILDNLAVVHAARQEWAEAVAAVDRSRRVSRRHAARILPALADHEQLTFLRATDQRHLHQALSLGLLRRADAALTARSAAWLVNGKAVAHEALAQRTLLQRNTADPQRRDLVRQFQDLSRQRAALALSAPAPGQEQRRRQQLDDLADRQQQLERQFGRDVSSVDPWVEIDTVRRALPIDALLVDIASFHVLNFEAKGTERRWQQARYAAWVIPPADQGDVRVLDLGEAEQIDAAVTAVRQALADAVTSKGTIRTQGEANAEKAVREPLQALAKLVLHPLLEAVGDRKRLLLSPDGALWLAPWSALPLPDGSYAVERYSLRLLQSGRDLVAGPGRFAQPAAPLLFADPTFGDAPAERRSVKGGESLAEVLPPVGRLPYTRAEALAVQPALVAYAGTTPRLFLGEEASKATFRREAARPRVLMLSTHGYFLEDIHLKPTDNRLALASEGTRSAQVALPPLANPLLRCGLLLAGANRRGADAEQGVLTGLEIVSTDLRGTELVVLSACETGLGQVNQGEGVAGLRQAFQLAGAEAVLASLWSVDDRATADLMKRFFAGLSKDKDKADVLSAVQRELIAARRERNGAAHPFYWAAFTLTGVPDEVLARRPAAQVTAAPPPMEDWLEVTAAEAAVRLGEQVLIRLPRASKYRVEKTQGEWHLIAAEDTTGKVHRGYVHRDLVRIFQKPAATSR